MIYMIDLTASCTFAVFCTLIKKRWNNAFFVPSVQGQVRDGISSDNNGMQVDGLIDGGTFGARQLGSWRAKSGLGARQLPSWRAPTSQLARAKSGLGAPTCDLARQLVNLREPRPGKPTLGLLYRVGVFSAREGHETRGFLG